MGRLIVFNMMSLDGFFSRINGELDWHVVDDEFNKFAIVQLNEVDSLLFGRVTYQFMASYWTSPQGIQDDSLVAKRMNSIPKVAVSKTLKETTWENSTLLGDNLEAEISKLKAEPNKKIMLLGSANLLTSLLNLNLVDEIRVMINPVILGSGRPLFQEIKSDIKLRLDNSRFFKSGNVLNTYSLSSNSQK